MTADDPRHRLGRDGEAAAEALLGRAGFRILARRFRCRGGELDLVVADGDVIVFVEVKTRSGDAFGRPADAVSGRKRSRMARAGLAFLAARGLLDHASRFDVVEVGVDGRGRATPMGHIRDAFRL